VRRLALHLYWRAFPWLAVIGSALCSCAAVRRAADDVGEKGVDAASGAGLGFLLWLVHPVGWIGGALAAAGGAIGALLFGGGDTTIHEAPASPWSGALVVLALVLGVLILRAWGHWAPPLLEVAKRTVKGAPRALLGGRPKPAPKPNRFVRRVD
jgi:hypothetical protein